MSDGIDASLARIRQMQAAVPSNREQAPISLPRAAERPTNPWDVLTRLGFAMASSRNPSLFGQLGEAGINLQDYQRQQRRDAREEDEMELNRVYREAQLNFQREQLRGDPVRLATAEAALLEARARLEAARAQGAGVGREMRGIVSQQWTDDGRLIGVRRDGTTVELQAPGGGRFANPQLDVRRDQQWLGVYQRTFEALSRNPININTPPEQIARQAQAAADAAIARTQGNRGAAPQVGTPPTVVVDPAGRPISR